MTNTPKVPCDAATAAEFITEATHATVPVLLDVVGRYADRIVDDWSRHKALAYFVASLASSLISTMAVAGTSEERISKETQRLIEDALKVSRTRKSQIAVAN